MAQQQQNIVIRSPASQGINTEDSPVGLDLDFCLSAENAVIERLGRLGSRKGFAEYTTNINVMYTTPIGTARTDIAVEQIVSGEISGTTYVLCVVSVLHYDNTNTLIEGHYFICLDDGVNTLNALSYPTLTDPSTLRDAHLVYFNEAVYIFSSGNPALVFNGTTVSALFTGVADTDYIAPVDDTGTIASQIDGDVALSAYGRLWVTGVNNNYNVIYYSDLLIATQWYDGRATPASAQNTGGIIDVSEFWPNGGDRIVGLAAHNNFLIVFGRNSILFYSNAASGDPAGADGIFLQDTMNDMGLLGRDAIANIGSDVLFVDDSGVRSLGRTVQEKSVPVGDLTRNVRRELRAALQETEQSKVALSYWPSEDITVCLLPSRNQAYVMDMRALSKTGGSKVTRWNNCRFNKMEHYQDRTQEFVLLAGSVGQGLLKYEGYTDWTNNPFVFKYQSGLIDFGNPVVSKFLKQIDYTIFSLFEETTATARWGHDGNLTKKFPLSIDALLPSYYGSALFGVSQYGAADNTMKRYKVNASGSGESVRVGLDVQINGNEVSIQEINIQTLLGRVI